MFVPEPLLLPVRSATATVVHVKVAPDTSELRAILLVLPLQILSSVVPVYSTSGRMVTLMLLALPVQLFAVAVTTYTTV